jgi:hypothetical protein
MSDVGTVDETPLTMKARNAITEVGRGDLPWLTTFAGLQLELLANCYDYDMQITNASFIIL